MLVPPLFDALDDQLAHQVPPRVADPIHAHLVRSLPPPVAHEIVGGLLSSLPEVIAHKIWGTALPFLVRGATHSVAEGVALSLAVQPGEVLACARCESFPFPERMGPHPGSAFAFGEASSSTSDSGPLFSGASPSMGAAGGTGASFLRPGGNPSDTSSSSQGHQEEFLPYILRLRRLWNEFGFDPETPAGIATGGRDACELCAAHQRARPDLGELQTLAWHWSAWFSDQCLTDPELRF